MKEALFVSGNAMQIAMDRVAILANNLANINTIGFKKDRDFVSALKDNLTQSSFDGSNSVKPEMSAIITDHAKGTIHLTENPLDFAVDGEGFFKVQTPEGAVRYTRKGVFDLNKEHQLVTRSGHLVLGKNGPIVLENSDINVDEEGYIYNNNGTKIDQLAIVDFKQPYPLEKIGSTLFIQTDPLASEQEFKGLVKHRFIENSNVDAVSSMVEMITLMESLRNYETNQKLVQYQDGLMDKMINSVGRV